jgi:hypothetical protein
MDLEGNSTTRSRSPVNTAPGVARPSMIPRDRSQSSGVTRDRFGNLIGGRVSLRSYIARLRLAKNGKYVVIYPHFMFATLALRSIKCVNSNL